MRFLRAVWFPLIDVLWILGACMLFALLALWLLSLLGFAVFSFILMIDPDTSWALYGYGVSSLVAMIGFVLVVVSLA